MLESALLLFDTQHFSFVFLLGSANWGFLLVTLQKYWIKGIFWTKNYCFIQRNLILFDPIFVRLTKSNWIVIWTWSNGQRPCLLCVRRIVNLFFERPLDRRRPSFLGKKEKVDLSTYFLFQTCPLCNACHHKEVKESEGFFITLFLPYFQHLFTKLDLFGGP